MRARRVFLSATSSEVDSLRLTEVNVSCDGTNVRAAERLSLPAGAEQVEVHWVFYLPGLMLTTISISAQQVTLAGIPYSDKMPCHTMFTTQSYTQIYMKAMSAPALRRMMPLPQQDLP